MAAKQPPPLRERTVVDTNDKSLYTYPVVRHAEGKLFYVTTTLCALPPGTRVKVLSGPPYDEKRIELLGGVVRDVSVAMTLEVDGTERKGFSVTHQLPPKGCKPAE